MVSGAERRRNKILLGVLRLFLPEPLVSQTEKYIFLMYSQGLKFTITFLSSSSFLSVERGQVPLILHR